MSSNPVLVNTLQQTKTDPYSTLAVSSVGYYSIVLLATNKGSSNASFRIRKDSLSGPTTAATVVNVGQTWSCNVGDTWAVTPGTSYKFMLERLENNSWVLQSSDPNAWTVANTPTSALQLVTQSPQSVTLSWSTELSAVPQPEWCLGFTKDLTSTALADAIKTMTWASVPASTATSTSKTVTVTVGSLAAQTTYSIWLCVKDRSNPSLYTPDHFNVIAVNNQQFSTSVQGNISATSVRVSYAKLAWTGNVSDSYRVIDVTQNGAVVATSTGPASNVTYKNLTGGKVYKLVLQRILSDGSTSDESQVTVSTPTSSLSIVSVGSTQVKVAWTSVYDGAKYEIHYGTAPTAMKIIDASTDTSATLTNLMASSTYAVELYVIENNAAVGVSAIKLGTSDDTSTSSSSSAAAAPTVTAQSVPSTKPAQVIVQKASTPVNKNRMSTGEIIGLAVGGSVILAIIIAIVMSMKKKK